MAHCIEVRINKQYYACDYLAIIINCLGLFYYIIANLRPELRSTYRCIQLISIVMSPVLIKYGFDEVLKPFVRDVNNLGNASTKLSYFMFYFMFTKNVYMLSGWNCCANQWK